MSAPARVWVDHMARHAEGIMRGLHCLTSGKAISYEEVSGMNPPALAYPEPPQPGSREGRLRQRGWSLVPVPDRKGYETEATPLYWGEAQWLAVPPEDQPEPPRVFSTRGAAVRWAWGVAATQSDRGGAS